MTAIVTAVRGGFGRCRGRRGRHGRFGRPPSDCLDHDGERNEAQPLPRSDLLLELANDGDARRRELGRGQCGARRERQRKREQVRWGREARQGADASFTTERGGRRVGAWRHGSRGMAPVPSLHSEKKRSFTKNPLAPLSVITKRSRVTFRDFIKAPNHFYKFYKNL